MQYVCICIYTQHIYTFFPRSCYLSLFWHIREVYMLKIFSQFSSSLFFFGMRFSLSWFLPPLFEFLYYNGNVMCAQIQYMMVDFVLSAIKCSCVCMPIIWVSCVYLRLQRFPYDMRKASNLDIFKRFLHRELRTPLQWTARKSFFLWKYRKRQTNQMIFMAKSENGHALPYKF